MKKKEDNKKTVKKPTKKIVDKTIKLDKTIKPEQELKTSGLGDLVSKVTSALGIKECEGCKERKEKWNATFPWLKGQRDMTTEEYKKIKEIEKNKIVEAEDASWLFTFYNEIFKSKLEKCNCPGLVAVMVGRLCEWGDLNV